MINVKVEGLTESEARSLAEQLDGAIEDMLVDGTDVGLMEALQTGLRQVTD